MSVQNDAGKRLTPRRYGSDFIVDLLRRYQLPYAAFNPGASFRGIHDSLVNYLGNESPEFLECMHEEISVAIAHGYARATGRPMAAILHNVVGLQHATMAIYNAWCDRIPIILLGGTGPMSYTKRRPGSDWVHTALVQGNLIRDFVKWDDQPDDLDSTPESFARAYQTAMTHPQGPVYICYDAQIQEVECERFPELPDPSKFQPPEPPAAGPQTIQRIARALCEAEAPVIVADRMGRSAIAFDALLRLAELLGIPVLDQGNRHNFPTRHPLFLVESAAQVLAEADFVLALDAMDLYGALHTVDRLTRETRPMYKPGTRIAHVTLDGYAVRSWSHDFRRVQETDDAIAADTESFVPALLERCHAVVEGRGDVVKAAQERLAKWSAHSEKLRNEWRARAQSESGGEPIALSTFAAIVWDAVKDEPWVLTNGIANGWVKRIWDISRPDQYMGRYSGGGLGYGMGSSLGATLANPGRLCVNLQGDGDFLFTPTALWTAAHHGIPLLTIIMNNRSYYNSEEHGEKIAAHRSRPVENAALGTRIENPDFDYAAMARSMGVHGEGPVMRSADLPEALRRAIEQVKQGRPALVEVRTQNR
ncbi:thiamine pyrophosphate-binding protein [Pusillimonas caeni]|uniref:thiamine pyrophosphate-binding protein n=1 Tax=Pusillimonas caeni TaxID=1348472 RepID=UPI000E59CF30|nr:thiamine pyrophosphate-dependent enzyme [Pusillimonas caeni]TFL09388.1 thiamine pyrophosphate-binding protein [Pusillimonas caeni]